MTHALTNGLQKQICLLLGGMRLVQYENRIWAIGGYEDIGFSNKVESYDPTLDSWQSATCLQQNGILYAAGGRTGQLCTIVAYNQITKLWSSVGNLPENKYVADAPLF